MIYSASKATIVIKQWLSYFAQNEGYALLWQADSDHQETCIVTKFIRENKWAMVRLCLIHFYRGQRPCLACLAYSR